MPSSPDNSLAILGLSPGATADEIKQAFRDLAQVWHPDRFAHDARLRAKAEEKFKQINAAYQELTAPSPAGSPRKSGTFAGTAREQLPRFVRMALPGVGVTFDGRSARLINISISGGQLLIDPAPRVNSRAVLVLAANGHRLELDTHVVRVSAPSARQAPGMGRSEPIVSIKFVNLSPQAQRAIPRFYNLLLDAATSTAGR